MKEPLSMWKKALLVVVPLILLLSLLSNGRHARYGSGRCDEMQSIQVLSQTLESVGGKEIIIAGKNWDSFALQYNKISARCGPGFQGEMTYIAYYPRLRALGFHYEGHPFKMIYGVTRADIERVANAGGSLKDFEKTQ